MYLGKTWVLVQWFYDLPRGRNDHFCVSSSLLIDEHFLWFSLAKVGDSWSSKRPLSFGGKQQKNNKTKKWRKLKTGLCPRAGPTKQKQTNNRQITNLCCSHTCGEKEVVSGLHARTTAGRMQWGRANSRGLSRGVEQSAVHQGAVVAILDQIVRFAGVAALRRLARDADLHGVIGVVEINDVNVKDEHGRAGDEISCGG